MIQKYLSSGGGRRIAVLFVDAICTEGERIFLNLDDANGPHLEIIAKNLPSANDGGYAAPWNVRRKLSLIFPSLVARNNCGYAPWNIRRAFSLNDFGGLTETQPPLPAPNTPDIDVWMVGTLNLNYFRTMVEERSQTENRSAGECEVPLDHAAFSIITKKVLDHARFERALRKLMMSLNPEAFASKPEGSAG